MFFLRKIKRYKEILAWSFYDFANQPFTTIIVTFIYSYFFAKVIVLDDPDLGTLLWTQAISITAIIVAFLSPILGSLADKGGYRKMFFMFFTYLCVIFTGFLYFPEQGDVYLSLTLFIIANMSFEFGSVFCNSYLSDISKKKYIGRISGFAWGLGFLGGLISLYFCFQLFDLEDHEHIRQINILVAVWLFIFSIPTFLYVKDRKKKKFNKEIVKDSFNSLLSTFREISKYKIIFRFLIARLFFNDALITIFSLGGIYAGITLNFTASEVLLLAIVLNISAVIGSFLFGYLEDIIGVKKVIQFSLIVLIFATLLAYFAAYFDPNETNLPKQMFWVAGVLIGLMVGPNQSSSRSLMSRLTPKEKQNEFFGFFAFAGKATSFLGPFLFGLVTFHYKSQQLALWVVIVLFLIGLFLFNNIDFEEE